MNFVLLSGMFLIAAQEAPAFVSGSAVNGSGVSSTAVNGTDENQENITAEQFLNNLNKAEALFKHGRYQDALKIYLELTSNPYFSRLRKPQRMELILRVANCYYNLKRYDEVLDILESEEVLLWCRKDERCSLLRGLALLKAGKDEQGEPLLREALSRKFDPAAAYELALHYFSRKSYTRSLNLLKRVAVLSSGRLRKDTYELMAECYFHLREWEKAFRYFSLSGNREKANLSKAYDLSLKGNECFSRKDFSSAIIYYRKALQVRDEPAIRVSLASAYLAVGDEKSLEEAMKVLEPVRDDPTAALLLVSIYTRLGRTEEASRLKNRIDNLVAKDPSANHLLAVSYYERGNYKKASEYIERAISLGGEYSSDAAVIFYSWGLSLLKEGKARESVEKFRKALKYDPDFGEVREAIKIALRQKRLREATEKISRARTYRDVLKVVADYDELPEVFQFAARKLASDPLKAMKILKIGIEAHPDYEPLYRDYMAVLKKYVSREEVVSEDFYREPLSLFRVAVNYISTPYILATYAELLELVGKDGSEYIEKAVSASDNADAQTLAKIAKYFYLKGDYKKAYQFYSKASDKDPNEPSYFYNMAFVLYKMGQSEEALKMLKEGLKRFPKEAPYHYLSAKILFARGEYSGAYNEISKAFELAPYSSRYRWLRANIAYYAGRREEARSLFRELLNNPRYSLRARRALASLFPDTLLVYSAGIKIRKVIPYMGNVLCLSDSTLRLCRGETFKEVETIATGVKDFAVFSNYVVVRRVRRRKVLLEVLEAIAKNPTNGSGSRLSCTKPKFRIRTFELGRFSSGKFYFPEDGIYMLHRSTLYFSSAGGLFRKGVASFKKVMKGVSHVRVNESSGMGILEVSISGKRYLMRNGRVFFKPHRGTEMLSVSAVDGFGYVLVKAGVKMFIYGVRDGRTEERVEVPLSIARKLSKKPELVSDGVNLVLWSKSSREIFVRRGERFQVLKINRKIDDISLLNNKLFLLCGKKVFVYSVSSGELLNSFDSSDVKLLYMGG